MKKFLALFSLLILCSSVYADKYLYLTPGSKPIKLTDSDFNILCDNSICLNDSSRETESSNKAIDFVSAFYWVLAEKNKGTDISDLKNVSKGTIENIKQIKDTDNEVFLVDELIEVDILGDSPIKIIKKVSLFRDDETHSLFLKTLSGNKVRIYHYNTNIPSFGRKIDTLIIKRCIWKNDNGTYTLCWLPIPMEMNDGKYGSPDWWD